MRRAKDLWKADATFDELASIFWQEAVGRIPFDWRVDWRLERAINTLIDGYILDMGIAPQTKSHLTLIDMLVIWWRIEADVYRARLSGTLQAIMAASVLACENHS